MNTFLYYLPLESIQLMFNDFEEAVTTYPSSSLKVLKKFQEVLS